MPDVMAGGPPSVAPPMPAPPPTVPTGPTGPATVAPQMDGRRLQGMIQAQIAVSALERAAGVLGGSATPDGQAILEAVLKLRKHFGAAAADLQQQELKSLQQAIPPVARPTPEQGASFEAAIKARQAQEGLPGAMAGAGGMP